MDLNNEKNVSTEQSSSQTNPWVSHAHEHNCGSRRSQTTARQRPQTADSRRAPEARTTLTATGQEQLRTFPKSARLLERRDFLFLQQRGQKRHSQHFLIITAPAQQQRNRFGITASRRFGNAVVRNRMKRLLREFFRTHRAEITPARDIIVIPKAGAQQLTLPQITAELGKALAIVSISR
jgi:ribonuclease P protein component